MNAEKICMRICHLPFYLLLLFGHKKEAILVWKEFLVLILLFDIMILQILKIFYKGFLINQIKGIIL